MVSEEYLGFKLVKGGALVSIQDRGRHRYQSFGLPKGGAMDTFSMDIVNHLLGNPKGSPVLELTLMGGEIEFEGTGFIAVSGGDLQAHFNEAKLALNQIIRVKKGDRLSFGHAIDGCRAYLGVQGDWMLDKRLGSYSPIFGLDSMSIEVGKSFKVLRNDNYKFNPINDEFFETSTRAFRVLEGPEFAILDPGALVQFLEESFEVSTQSNRMGIRLDGPKLQFKERMEMISSAIIPGTIQLTKKGMPIILTADAQTTGGYPRIFKVAQVDMDRLGQLRPGQKIHFEIISRYDALKLWKKDKQRREELFGSLR